MTDTSSISNIQPFWALSSDKAHGELIACVDENNSSHTYSNLNQLIQEKIVQLPQTRSLCIIQCCNSLHTLVNYLACLNAGHCAILLDCSGESSTSTQANSSALDLAIKAYQPNFMLNENNIYHLNEDKIDLAEDLAIMLSTSGSTGTAKFVCLSYSALQANCEGILQYLPIKQKDTVVTTLPFAYSFGLSVINTHLASHACIVLNDASILESGFWERVETCQPAGFYGVPFTFEMLTRLRGLERFSTSLRYVAQAGGLLQPRFKTSLNTACAQRNIAFYVMYGQTEATARIAYLEPKNVNAKTTSIGKAIAGGKLVLKDERGARVSKPHQKGELVYTGPNVMLGYASEQTDLAEFKALSELPTGDLAYFDNDGDFFVCGRLKRMVKLSGVRTNLDEVEMLLTKHNIAAKVVGRDDKLVCFVEKDTMAEAEAANGKYEHVSVDNKFIAKVLNVTPRMIDLNRVDAFPTLPNGKIDYMSLNALC